MKKSIKTIGLLAALAMGLTSPLFYKSPISPRATRLIAR